MTREDVRAIMRREAMIAIAVAVIGCVVTAWCSTPIHLSVTARGMGAALVVLVSDVVLVAGLVALHRRLLGTSWSSRLCVSATTIFAVAFPVTGAIVLARTITETTTIRIIVVYVAIIIVHTGIMVGTALLIERGFTALRRRILGASRSESS